MEFQDDDLIQFEAEGAAPLPVTNGQIYIENDGARIWYATYGLGSPVILLHGGLGHSGNWGYQVPALVEHGYRAIVIDSRGHGRSTRDEQPYTYQLMASDVVAVMNILKIEKAAFVGWSDGACTALVSRQRLPLVWQVCSTSPATWIPAAPKNSSSHQLLSAVSTGI